jgi:tetratricopeptide (TPR) repeat protein
VKGKDSFECASTLYNIGLVYIDQGKLIKALRYSERALIIYERVKGKDSFDCIDTLKNIGLILWNQDKLN